MIKESFVLDSETNCLMLVWPSVYHERIFWYDLLKIYYEIINIVISNGYHMILIHHKSVNIENNLSIIDKNLSDISNDYSKFISFHEYQNDDIWIRDYGPKVTKQGLIKFNYNGYGKKYYHANDSIYFDDFIKKYTLGYKDIFSNVVIEGGNIINSSRDYIFNKNPIVAHNSLCWTTIEKKIKSLFSQFIDGNYYYIDIKELRGDDTNGHIDNLVRFKNNSTLLYMSSNDPNHPDYDVLKELENQLKELIKKNNNIDSMIPIDHSHQDIVKDKNGTILPFSYLNFIMIGNVIIFPANANTSSNKKKYLETLFSDNNVYFIESSALLNEFGGLHCCSNNFVI